MDEHLINPAGLAIIKANEGFRLEAYQDQRGIWTIGYGHTPAQFGQTMSQAEADATLQADVQWAEDAVNAGTHDVPTTDDQFSAMVSLTFNIGPRAFKTSTVLREHRARDNAAAADAFLMWDKTHIDGSLVIDPPLLRRRQEERSLYLSVSD